jgi:hypothetical protein
MIQLYDTRVSVLVRGDSWSVSLVQFCIQGDIDADVFLLTHRCDDIVASDLFHFVSCARQQFLDWVEFYSLLYGENYVVERVRT